MHKAEINGYTFEYEDIRKAELVFARSEFEMLQSINSKITSVKNSEGLEVEPITLDDDTVDELLMVMMSGLARNGKRGR